MVVGESWRFSFLFNWAFWDIFVNSFEIVNNPDCISSYCCLNIVFTYRIRLIFPSSHQLLFYLFLESVNIYPWYTFHVYLNPGVSIRKEYIHYNTESSRSFWCMSPWTTALPVRLAIMNQPRNVDLSIHSYILGNPLPW